MKSDIGYRKASIYLKLTFFTALIFSGTGFSITVHLSESPTNDLTLTLKAIKSAQSSLYINVYEMTSAKIADAIRERVEAGVHVEVLEEGQPIPKYPKAG